MKTTKNKVDWLTPPEDVENIIVPILGGMPDVNPCDHPVSFVKAKHRFYGDKDAPISDGFKQKWHKMGRTAYVNPSALNLPPKQNECPHPLPYFHKLSEWVTKMYLEGQHMTVLAMLPNTVDRAWFHNYVVDANAFCLLEQRRQCHQPDGNGGTISMKQPNGGHQYVLWTGEQNIIDRFCDVLSDEGLIVEPTGQ